MHGETWRDDWVEPEFTPFQGKTLEILIAWSKKCHEAMELIELACQTHLDATTGEALVGLIDRLFGEWRGRPGP